MEERFQETSYSSYPPFLPLTAAAAGFFFAQHAKARSGPSPAFRSCSFPIMTPFRPVAQRVAALEFFSKMGKSCIIRGRPVNVIFSDKWRGFFSAICRYVEPMTRVLRAAATTSSVITVRPLIFMMRSICTTGLCHALFRPITLGPVDDDGRAAQCPRPINSAQSTRPRANLSRSPRPPAASAHSQLSPAAKTPGTVVRQSASTAMGFAAAGVGSPNPTPSCSTSCDR